MADPMPAQHRARVLRTGEADDASCLAAGDGTPRKYCVPGLAGISILQEH
jgi:hypothetical protein